ncbi:sigma-54 interaction domain-containing protein [Peribacillus butanolivorans]|uniref:sigma-54 interaction domain-containing protein n=1 Tax=Peribacillus butanolivorans TaxID=421767 RepID=UPI0036DD44B8
MINNYNLISIAKPWESHFDLSQMGKYRLDSGLYEIDENNLKEGMALIDGNNQPCGWVQTSIFIDYILNQSRTDKSFYQTLIASIDDAITIIDQDGVILAWNHRSEEIYGSSNKEVINKNIREFFEEKSLLMEVLKTKKKVVKHYHQPLPNAHVLINALPVYSNNQIVGGISVDRDITDLVKINEELSQTTAYARNLERKLEKETVYNPLAKIKGKSPAVKKALEITRKISKTDATVLITGESGVGKELFAEAIHKASHRSDYPFIAINCGAIPSALFESELFGYEKGSFTGAMTSGKKGKIDAAKNGTLFLDEIGEMPLELQAKLLRVLQEKEFYQIGGNKPIPVRAGIIAATNKDLKEMVTQKKFREDLYYRLNVISLSIPSLKERREDIFEFVELFLNEFSTELGIPTPDIDKQVMNAFLKYDWPGNIRELRNVIQRIVILGAGDGVITLEYVPNEIVKHDSALESPPVLLSPRVNKIIDSEKAQIEYALNTTFGNKSAAAKLLGISRGTLYNKMKIYQLIH